MTSSGLTLTIGPSFTAMYGEQDAELTILRGRQVNKKKVVTTSKTRASKVFGVMSKLRKYLRHDSHV